MENVNVGSSPAAKAAESTIDSVNEQLRIPPRNREHFSPQRAHTQTHTCRLTNALTGDGFYFSFALFSPVGWFCLVTFAQVLSYAER